MAEAAMSALWDAFHLSNGQHVLFSHQQRIKYRELYYELGRKILGYGIPTKESH